MNNQTASKKLALRSEILRVLDRDELDGVNGGKGTATVSAGVQGLAQGLYNDTVYRPAQDKQGNNDTVYRGGGRVVPV